MRVRKVKGATQIGELTVDRDNVPAVRQCVVDLIESDWTPYGGDEPPAERSPLTQHPPAVAYPAGEDEDAYIYLSVSGETTEVPDQSFVFKLLQLL